MRSHRSLIFRSRRVHSYSTQVLTFQCTHLLREGSQPGPASLFHVPSQMHRLCIAFSGLLSNRLLIRLLSKRENQSQIECRHPPSAIPSPTRTTRICGDSRVSPALSTTHDDKSGHCDDRDDRDARRY